MLSQLCFEDQRSTSTRIAIIPLRDPFPFWMKSLRVVREKNRIGCQKMKIRYFKNRFLGGLFFKDPHPGGSFSRGVDFCPYFCSALRGSLNVQNGTFYGGGYPPASQIVILSCFGSMKLNKGIKDVSCLPFLNDKLYKYRVKQDSP